MYPINFTVTKKKFCLSLHYNELYSYLFVNGTEIIKFKAKDSETVASPLCLGNISKDWSVGNMKKIGFNGYIYDLYLILMILKRSTCIWLKKWHSTCLKTLVAKQRINESI